MGEKSGNRFRELLRVKPGQKVDLASFDCGATFGREKADAEVTLNGYLTRLADLQERIYAEAKHPVLIVLQGIDAAGKDGTIRIIAGAFNPQGTPVTSFKEPTPKELAHDYLWRVHAALPGKGDGPLLIVLDDGWAAAPTWDGRAAYALEAATRAGRLVALAPTSQGARETFYQHYAHYLADQSRGRFRVSREAYELAASPRGALYVGSPQEIIDKALAQHELFGHGRILGQMDIGALPYAALSRSVELFATEVAPVLRKATADATDDAAAASG